MVRGNRDEGRKRRKRGFIWRKGFCITTVQPCEYRVFTECIISQIIVKPEGGEVVQDNHENGGWIYSVETRSEVTLCSDGTRVKTKPGWNVILVKLHFTNELGKFRSRK